MGAKTINIEEIQWKARAPAPGEFRCFVCDEDVATHRQTIVSDGAMVKLCVCLPCVSVAPMMVDMTVMRGAEVQKK